MRLPPGIPGNRIQKAAHSSITLRSRLHGFLLNNIRERRGKHKHLPNIHSFVHPHVPERARERAQETSRFSLAVCSQLLTKARSSEMLVMSSFF